jgi:hypothetical protein
MKLFKTAIILLLLVCAALGQNTKTNGPSFDIQDFNKKFQVVEWLVEYDNVAWKTTDVVMALPKAELERLGQEWFCFQDTNKVWHAVYGKLTEDKYDPVVHLEMDAKEKITRSDQKIDQQFLDRHALALKTGRDKLTATIPADSPRFNQFIRQNPDKTFSVWLLPAFQPNRLTVYGGEAIYTVDASGLKILKDESYFQKDFRGFMSEPPREIWLNYREMEKPSLGAIFFVWYYKAYFTKIFIDNAKSTSTAIKAGDGYMWLHVEKDETPKPIEKGEPTKPRLERKKPGDD